MGTLTYTLDWLKPVNEVSVPAENSMVAFRLAPLMFPQEPGTAPSKVKCQGCELGKMDPG